MRAEDHWKLPLGRTQIIGHKLYNFFLLVIKWLLYIRRCSPKPMDEVEFSMRTNRIVLEAVDYIFETIDS